MRDEKTQCDSLEWATLQSVKFHHSSLNLYVSLGRLPSG